MSRRMAVVAVVLLVLPAANVVTLTAQSKHFTQTYPFEPGGRLTLDTYKGSIHVSSWESSQVEVVAEIAAPDDVSRQYAQRAIDATRIDVSAGTRSVHVKSDYDKVPSRNFLFGESKTLPFIHYRIRVPRSVDLRIKDYKSSIEVYGLDGRIDLETYKGTVDAADLGGELVLETYKGKARMLGIRGNVDVETYKGEVAVELLVMTGRSRIETYKGVVDLALPREQSFSLRADIEKRGDFATDFELSTPMPSRNRGKHFRAEVNGGGPEVSLSTNKGEIRLKRQ